MSLALEKTEHAREGYASLFSEYEKSTHIKFFIPLGNSTNNTHKVAHTLLNVKKTFNDLFGWSPDAISPHEVEKIDNLAKKCLRTYQNNLFHFFHALVNHCPYDVCREWHQNFFEKENKIIDQNFLDISKLDTPLRLRFFSQLEEFLDQSTTLYAIGEIEYLSLENCNITSLPERQLSKLQNYAH